MKRYTIAIFAVLLLASGCMGIIINGSSEEVTFNTTPTGADVSIDGAFAGVTPLSIDLPRGESHLAEITLDGFEDEAFQIRRSADAGIIIMDILFTGGIGLLIDLGTGAMYKLDPTEISTSLQNIAVVGNTINVSMNPVR
jgi:hypothetical protein